MELILMRHGKTEEHNAKTKDADRRLTAKGREKTRAAASAILILLKQGSPVTIWTSPVLRAMQTAELVAEVIKGASLAAKAAIASGDLDELIQDLKDFDREGTLIVIGQEPYLSHWGARIASVILPIKTASAVAFEMTSLVPPQGELLWYANNQSLQRLTRTSARA